MGLALTGSFQVYAGYPNATPQTLGLTVPGDAVALVVACGMPRAEGSLQANGAPEFGGLAMTRVKIEDVSEIWFLDDISGRADDDLTFTTADHDDAAVGAQFISSTTGAVQLHSVDSATVGSFASKCTTTVDPSPASGVLAYISGSYRDVSGVTLGHIAPFGSQTELDEIIFDSTVNNQSWLAGISTSTELGVSLTGESGSHAAISVALFNAGETEVIPPPWGTEVGLGSNLAVVHSSNLILQGYRFRAIEVGLFASAFEINAPRQVALVGNDLETAEMTEGGAEEDLLTYHVNRKPTWEHAKVYAGEHLVEDGSSAPPVDLTNEAEDDWLYEDV